MITVPLVREPQWIQAIVAVCMIDVGRLATDLAFPRKMFLRAEHLFEP
jgi:hypothetical protein